MKSSRINFLFGLVPDCGDRIVADVGCDHGRLGAMLIRSGKARYVINVDNKPKPLENAIATAHRTNTAHRTFTVLNDGLRNLREKVPLDPFAIGCVVIAGLGAGSIISILDADDATADGTVFVLQTQTHPQKLKSYLLQRRFAIMSESARAGNGRVSHFVVAKKTAAGF